MKVKTPAVWTVTGAAEVEDILEEEKEEDEVPLAEELGVIEDEELEVIEEKDFGVFADEELEVIEEKDFGVFADEELGAIEDEELEDGPLELPTEAEEEVGFVD